MGIGADDRLPGAHFLLNEQLMTDAVPRAVLPDSPFPRELPHLHLHLGVVPGRRGNQMAGHETDPLRMGDGHIPHFAERLQGNGPEGIMPHDDVDIRHHDPAGPGLDPGLLGQDLL